MRALDFPLLLLDTYDIAIYDKDILWRPNDNVLDTCHLSCYTCSTVDTRVWFHGYVDNFKAKVKIKHLHRTHRLVLCL